MNEQNQGGSKFTPCPTCKQYSHSIGEDKLAEAFRHFETMFSHRGDGIPTQFVFDQQTRDAAQVLMAAARDAYNSLTGDDAVIERMARAIARAWIAADHPDHDADGYVNENWEAWQGEARAAYNSLHSPLDAEG